MNGRSLPVWILAVTLVFVGENAVGEAKGYDPLMVPEANQIKFLDLQVNDTQRERDIPVRIFWPTSHTPAPIVLVSHGLGGSREGSNYLGQHWAARGYIVIYLQHPGSDEGIWKNLPVSERAQAFQSAVAPRAAFAQLRARVLDVKRVLDELPVWNRDENADRFDLKRIGMSGHSFGAVTTQAVSGQSLPTGGSWVDARIQAALILSPSAPRRVRDPEQVFSDVRIPWLLMTGTRDVARIGTQTLGAPDIESRLAVFPALPAGDKYELILQDAEHMAFTDRSDFGANAPQRNPNHHRVILALSTAFWDAYLGQDAAAKQWLSGDGPRSVLEANDRWQMK